MRTLHCCSLPAPWVMLSVGLGCGMMLAQSASAAPSTGSGFTWQNTQESTTQWGLGAGIGYHQSPYDGVGAKYSPLPLLYFDDKWLHFFANQLDVKVGRWDTFSVSLRARYALGDGYKGSDAPILSDMQTRKGALWLGPSVAWQTAFGRLSVDYLLAGNKGQKAEIELSKDFNYGHFSVEPHIAAAWLSGSNVDYYYGVKQDEARPGREAYTATASYNLSAGTRFGYRFTEHQSISFDLGVTRLGSGITDSPLVSETWQPEAKLAYLYHF